MYKIYINETPLILKDSHDLGPEDKPSPDRLVARYTGKRKMLLNYIDMLEKSSRFDLVVLHYPDVDQLFQDLEGHFKVLEAAGGLVKREDEQILAIFRRGSWDLPKGKIDPGETPEEAAMREVNEETGIEGIELGDLLHLTYHTYRHPKKGRILKKTYWYHMKTHDQPLTPQSEEDIEQAVWVDLGTFLQENTQMYNSIRELLSHANEKG